ncbi:MAG TPA: Imm7 family immunity protein, partial [Candidatus Dormibacteraeota bacterium]
LLYERDDEMPVPPGPNAFRVRVLARGRIELRLDPFLSPNIPTIED